MDEPRRSPEGRFEMEAVVEALKTGTRDDLRGLQQRKGRLKEPDAFSSKHLSGFI
ncbi:uncharacterized protein V6R79_007872 [Siganus canaliculatus]